MRRGDREVTDPERIREIIADCDCCHVALWDGEKPYLVPLNFGYTEKGGGRSFYFHTAREGKKLTLMREHPLVGFQLDTHHELKTAAAAAGYSYYYSSITGSGFLQEVTDPAEKEEALSLLMEQMTGRRAGWDFAPCMAATCVLRLTVQELCAKENRAPAKCEVSD